MTEAVGLKFLEQLPEIIAAIGVVYVGYLSHRIVRQGRRNARRLNRVARHAKASADLTVEGNKVLADVHGMVSKKSDEPAEVIVVNPPDNPAEVHVEPDVETDEPPPRGGFHH